MPAELAESDTSVAKIGTVYITFPKTIKNYEADETLTNNSTGTVKSGTTTVTYKYNYVEPTNLSVHYYNAGNWADVYLYAYDESSGPVKQFTGAWPGTKMTSDGNGWYSLSVDEAEWGQIIFNSGSDANKEPAGANAPGYEASGEVWVKGGKVYPTGKVNVKYVSTDGKVLGTDILKGMADGTTSYTTTAKTLSGYTLTSTPTNAKGTYTADTINVVYTYKSNAVALANNSTISKTNLTVGDSIAVTGAASGGSGSYTYLFYYKKSGATKFTKFGSSSSATFQPTEAGTYTIRTYVNDSTGAAARKDFTVTVTEGFTNNTTISKTSVAVGGSITVTGAASGGSGSYTYEFYYKKSTATKFTKFGSSTTATFKPSESGTYTIRTYAKDSAGNVVGKDFTVTATVGLTNNTTISKTSVAVGGSITVTGAASGGSGSYTYEFYYKKSTATKFTKFGSSTTATFKPSKSGTYTIRTYAKDTAGNVAAKDFTVTATVGLTNNTTISKTSVAVGGSITVTGAASGGSGSYTYEFYYKKSTATKFTKFGSSTTATFKPTEVGTYTIRTYAKDTAGNVVGKDFTVTVTDSSELVNKTTLSYSDKIIIYGAATGGSGPYTYEFYYKLSTNSKYTALKASGTTATFTPVSDSNYNIRVYVKDTAGNIAVKNFTVLA